MPLGQPNPLTLYQHGRLLEEGCIQVMKTTVEKEGGERRGSVGSSDEDEDGELPSLRLQWTWNEGKR
jgi:hypothetical protein